MPVMPTAAELSVIESLLTETRTDTVLVTRPTQVSDGAGGFTTTYAEVHSYPGHVHQMEFRNAEELRIAEKVRGVEYWEITLPKQADVLIKDRLEVGTRQFEVVSVDAPQTIEVERNVIAKLIVG